MTVQVVSKKRRQSLRGKKEGETSTDPEKTHPSIRRDGKPLQSDARHQKLWGAGAMTLGGERRKKEARLV